MLHSDALTRLADWIDDRTGYRAGVSVLRDRVVTGGPRWSYATGACTLGLFTVVAATGVLLMASYSPAADHGWSSVHFIESTPGGRFLRGLHYWGSHALIVLFAVHLARAVLHASYRAPRELAWISGVLLLPLLATQAVTGNPLPASGKAFAQIQVESEIVAGMPVVGPLTRDVLIGGENVGHLTMTHLYALHVVVLPLLALALLTFHLYQNLRYGTRQGSEAERRLDGPTWWPNQSARNALVFGVVFGVVAVLAWRCGAPLEAPADPTLSQMPRPEWPFRFLFELRTWFSPALEFVATGLLPGLFLGFLCALPWIDARLPRPATTGLRYGVVVLAAAGWAGLTALSLAKDREDDAYRTFQVEAETRSARAGLLAELHGIPPDGPARLLQTDPLTQGPALFKRHCATCHPHLGPDGEGIPAAEPVAANLYGFASRDWIAGMLDPKRIAGPDYFGHTAFAEDEFDAMIGYVRDELYAVAPDELPARNRIVAEAVAALSAEAELPYQERADATAVAAGRAALVGDALGCVNCHKFRDAGELGSAPDLTGYGSRNWLAEFVSNPSHPRFYGENNDGMPAFVPAEPGSAANLLTREQLLLIVDWLRGDWPGR